VNDLVPRQEQLPRRPLIAERQEIALARERSQVIDVAGVVRLLSRRIGETKSILEALPDRIVGELADQLDNELQVYVRDIVATEVRNALERIAGLPQEASSPEKEN
jgi:hypothetical protein